MTATATSERAQRIEWRVKRLAAAALLLVAGTAGVVPAAAAPHQGPPAAFSWLRPAPPPAGWKAAPLEGGAATLFYPPAWHAIQTDPGTASAGLIGSHHRLVGYLNATPQQGAETLANWIEFRPEHVAKEGARHVRRTAAANALAFRSGRGACVIDTYQTSKARYREIACLVSGVHATTVIVGAAQLGSWARLAPSIERSISAFET